MKTSLIQKAIKFFKPIELSKQYREDIQMYESLFVVLGVFKFYQYFVRCSPSIKAYHKKAKFDRDNNGEFAWFRTFTVLPNAKYLQRPKPSQKIKITQEEFETKYFSNPWLIPENFTL